MAGFFQKIAGYLTYKEPKNDELGFELLEGENEGTPEPPQKAAPGAGQPEQPCGASGSPGESSGKSQFSRKSAKKEKRGAECSPPADPENVSSRLCDNVAVIKQKFAMPKNQDIIIRVFRIGRKLEAALAYIEGMIDKEQLNLSVFPQLMDREAGSDMGRECPLDYLIENILTVNKVYKSQKFTDVIKQMLTGASILFIEGCTECAVIDTRGYEKRGIDQPVTEKVVRGSQEGFTENLRTNITMVRRIIKNEKLITENLTVGKIDNIMCAVLYHEDLANPKVLQEVKKRIGRIDADFIGGDGMLEQFIEDRPNALFPQVLSTERPDRVASFIMEGQVVIILEGTPAALVVPMSFFRLLHTSEDANSRWIYATFLRILRICGLFVSTLLPGLYVAIVLFHPEAIPTELLVSIAQAKEPVPFPTIIELLILEVSFELIREGGIRVPTTIGQTLGIVGAIILGQAAVSAGLVSPVVVIITSITALGSFTLPNYEMAIAVRIERFLMIFAGAALGMFGISMMILIVSVLACAMKSFGVPFLAPVAPRTKINPDIFIRAPVWTQKDRPDGFNPPIRQKQGANVKNWSDEKNRN
jgi:spore germination protein KA